MAGADGEFILVEERSSDGKVAVRAVAVAFGLRLPGGGRRSGPVATASDGAAAADGGEWNAGLLGNPVLR